MEIDKNEVLQSETKDSVIPTYPKLLQEVGSRFNELWVELNMEKEKTRVLFEKVEKLRKGLTATIICLFLMALGMAALGFFR